MICSWYYIISNKYLPWELLSTLYSFSKVKSVHELRCPSLNKALFEQHWVTWTSFLRFLTLVDISMCLQWPHHWVRFALYPSKPSLSDKSLEITLQADRFGSQGACTQLTWDSLHNPKLASIHWSLVCPLESTEFQRLVTAQTKPICKSLFLYVPYYLFFFVFYYWTGLSFQPLQTLEGEIFRVPFSQHKQLRASPTEGSDLGSHQ